MVILGGGHCFLWARYPFTWKGAMRQQTYRGASLTRKRTPIRPYLRPMPRVMGEVLLCGWESVCGTWGMLRWSFHRKIVWVKGGYLWLSLTWRKWFLIVGVGIFLIHKSRLRPLAAEQSHLPWMTDSGLEEGHNTRRRRRVTYPESHITKYTTHTKFFDGVRAEPPP